ncbi:uncharacterized protein EURHEDRAFT_468048, partial [Aspergillus ruber CBS 135680]
EKLRSYGSSDYYPTRIGDRRFDRRYEAVYKLGHGSYSTVWLARDTEFVATKILTANISEYCSEGNIILVLDQGSLKLLARASMPG